MAKICTDYIAFERILYIETIVLFFFSGMPRIRDGLVVTHDWSGKNGFF